MPTASAISPQIEKELAVALRAQDRRRDLTGNRVPALLSKMAQVAENLAVLFRVAHEATLPHRPLPNLELRLHQRHDVARWAEEIADTRQRQPQRDERHIDHGQVRCYRQPIEVPDVDPLQN